MIGRMSIAKGVLALYLTLQWPLAVADAPPAVVIGGRVAHVLRVDAAKLAASPRRALDAADHGTPAHWEGVALADLLREAGVPLGDALRGRHLATYVRVTAADGYVAVFSLAELDPAMHDGTVLLADRRDGAALDAKKGPFRLVAAGDKRPARWVRQVVAIDVFAAP